VKEVRRIGNRLIAAIPEDERNEAFEYDFNVIESETVNAFALPGGPIYLYTGLLDELDTTDQVAALVAHEMVHVQNEHWASQHADNTKRQLGVGILLGLLGADRNTLNIASVVDQFLVGLPYSRKHENEADAEGLELMVRAGYNPMGAVELFEALKSNTEGSGPPEWMSTHPETDTRINNLREQIDEMDRDFPAQKPRSANKRWRTVQPREDTDDSLLGNRPAA
jgi:predicted Zn-dependent protease